MSKQTPIQKLSVGIIGNGAIGGLLASKCHQLNVTYHLLLRDKQSINLRVEDINGGQINISPKVVVSTDASNADILILPIKAYHILPALQALKHTIPLSQTIVLLHNGMGTIEQVKQLLPHNPCIAATTSYGAFKPSSNQLIETGLGDTHLGWVSSNIAENTQQVQTLLCALLPPSHWHSDINIALWKKLVVNAVINPLTAIHNIKNGQLAEAQYQSTIMQICEEVHQVTKALGYEFNLQELINLVKQVIANTANNYSSMYQDITHKRQTEIKFINGHVVDVANKLNIDTAQNSDLLKQIRLLEKSK